MLTTRIVSTLRIACRALGSGPWAAILVLVAPALGQADPLGPSSKGDVPVALAAATASAGSAAFEELTDGELDHLRGRFLECKTATPARKRVILWDEHRSIELPGPIGSIDPRNRIETGTGHVQPARMLLP